MFGKAFYERKSLVCVISKPAACFFIKYFGSTSFHSSKKRRERKKTNCQWQKIKSFFSELFSNSRNKKAAIDEFEQIRFVGWFVCLCSVVAAFYVCFFPFSAWEEEEEETYKERKMVHLHSWSDSLRAANRFESRLTWSALANRMLLRRNELWLWLLGPRFKNGFPWMIRTPFFSSSHWKKEATFVTRDLRDAITQNILKDLSGRGSAYSFQWNKQLKVRPSASLVGKVE